MKPIRPTRPDRPVRPVAAAAAEPESADKPDPRSVAALQAVLAAEHAAIYGYGIVGALLSGAAQQTARRAWEAHRGRRDRLRAAITQRGARPAAAAPAYQLPFPVGSQQAAMRLAATLEDGVTAAYLELAGTPNPRLRTYAAQAMQEAVTRATHWRGPGTPAFPGMPGPAVRPSPDTGAAGG